MTMTIDDNYNHVGNRQRQKCKMKLIGFLLTQILSYDLSFETVSSGLSCRLQCSKRKGIQRRKEDVKKRPPNVAEKEILS